MVGAATFAQVMSIGLLVVIPASLVSLAIAFLRGRPAARPGATRPIQWVFIALAIAAALAPAFWLLVAPIYSIGSSGSAGARGATLIDVNGWTALVPLTVAVLLTLVPIIPRRAETRTRVCASIGALLGVLSFIAGFSIGLFYVPAAAFLVAAGSVPPAARGAPPSHMLR